MKRPKMSFRFLPMMAISPLTALLFARPAIIRTSGTPLPAIKGPGRPAVDGEGNVTNSFLRPNLHTKFCTGCHGGESIVMFKYFHSAIGRQKKQENAPFAQ